MSKLVLTKKESDRLDGLMLESKIKATGHDWMRRPGRDEKILEMLNEGISTNQIIKKLRVSGATIVRVKKINGLWGA